MKESDNPGRMVMTMTAYGTEYSAALGDDANIDVVMGRMVVPLLLAIGYQRGSIEKMFKDGIPSEWDSVWQYGL